jgi:hypothetical protein
VPKWTRLGSLWPYALVAFLYLATSPYHQGLNNPNEMVRVYMSKAMVDTHTMAIDPVIREWGPVDDKAIRDGKLYSSKAPLQSLVGAPIYRALGPLYRALGVDAGKRSLTTGLRIFGSALFGIAFAFVLLAWSRRRAREIGASRSLGTAVGLSLALGTMIYPYSLTFTGHLLAACAAGGAYLCAIALGRHPPGSRAWRILAILLGLAAGAAPFAEYPSTLVVVPALAAAFLLTPTWEKRAELVPLVSIGGAPPFLLGLWAHRELWGSPWKTGYAFLENQAYVTVHGRGFFGVGAPRAEAFAGSLFSPGTGLFFYSPVLLIGLAALIVRVLEGKADPVGGDVRPTWASLPFALAVAGLAGFALETLFISGHQGWRGGWTLGPRYIIPVAPLLGVWVVEALARPRMRGFVASFGAISIVTTGFAAALYPHLSDVYTNPLKTFVWPSYLRGESSYGLAHALGLAGGAANLFHVVPLTIAAAYVALSGLADDGWRRRAIVLAATFAMVIGVIWSIPEQDVGAAERENVRLWGFWEPPRPKPPGLVFDARERFHEARVEAILADGTVRPCTWYDQLRCQYGSEAWHHFGPDTLELQGTRRPILYMHPMQGATVRALFPRIPAAARVTLHYGLADASVDSTNKDPVEVVVRQGPSLLARAETKNEHGLTSIDLALTSTAPIALEIAVKNEGARVFGFNLEEYAQ